MFIAYESIQDSDDESKKPKKRKKEESIPDTDDEAKEKIRKKAKRINK